MEIVKVNRNEGEHLLHFQVKANETEWKKAQNNAVNFLATKLKLKGFRAGKVPPNIAIKYLNQNAIFQRAIEKYIVVLYKEIINGKQLDEHDIIEDVYEANILKVEPNNLEVDFKFALSPKVKLFDYKKLKINYLEPNVTDQEVENQLQMLVKAKTNFKPDIDPEAVVQLGDRITIDFHATIDNKPFSGSEGKNYSLVLTKDEMVPGFNKQIIGSRVNTIKDFEVKFPNNYFDHELANKTALYHVELKHIDKVQKIEITDQVVKSLNLSGILTTKDLKEYFKKFLLNQKKNIEFTKARDQIVKQIVEQCSLDYIPKKILDQQKQYFLYQYEQKAKEQGFSLEKYVEFDKTIKTVEKLKELIEIQAKNNILLMFSLDQLKEELKIEIGHQEIENAYHDLALMQQKSIDEIKKQYRDTDQIKGVLIQDHVFHKLIELNKTK